MAKRPEAAQTGVKASVWLKEACNELNWVCNPLIEDFGIDFHVKAFESTAQRRALIREAVNQRGCSITDAAITDQANQ